jgi:carbohydrate kinase (thermoresistant glucokinase family)
MGVSGSGKTTVGEKLAAGLGWSFCDGDSLHPPANIAKMSAGTPLTDADRAPWLAAIRAYIDDLLARGRNGVVACSALREQYRHVLVSDPERVRIVCLWGDFGLIAQRMLQRKGHFMKENLLRSQFEALELPANALMVNVALSPDEIVAKIEEALDLEGCRRKGGRRRPGGGKAHGKTEKPHAQ